MFDDDNDQTTEGSGSLATLMQLSAAEIDQQIATARRYPRDIEEFKRSVEMQILTDKETAESMTYVLEREEYDRETRTKRKKLIPGPSVRFAEVLVNEYGNCRAGARALGADEDFVTAQGLFWNLEKNVAGFRERKAGIRTKDGKKYGHEMIKTTMNAAISTAYREAVLKGIPKALWQPLWMKAVKYVEGGDSAEVKKAWEKAVAWFGKKKVTPEMILKKLNRPNADEVTKEDIVILGAFSSQIREEDADPMEIFGEKTESTSPSEPQSKMDQAVQDMKAKKDDEKAQAQTV